MSKATEVAKIAADILKKLEGVSPEGRKAVMDFVNKMVEMGDPKVESQS